MALVRIQERRDTAANWTAANPVLAAGEPALELDTGKQKIGDGVRNWATLPYAHESILASSTPVAVGSASAGTSALASRADHAHALPSSLSATTIAVSGNATVGGNLSVTGTLTTGSLSVPAGSVTGLSEAVDDRVAALLVAGTGITLTYNDAANTLAVAVGTHVHTILNVTGLQAALDLKSDTGHTHLIADVAELAAALTARPVSSITGITGGTAITNIVALSQTNYDALSTKSSTTLYVIS